MTHPLERMWHPTTKVPLLTCMYWYLYPNGPYIFAPPSDVYNNYFVPPAASLARLITAMVIVCRLKLWITYTRTVYRFLTNLLFILQFLYI